MLGFNYQKSFDGYYMIPTGDVSMEDNKVVFVSGTVQDPYIDRVLTINNVSNDELSYYVSEVINCGGQLESISYLEDLAGKRIFEEYTSADFEDYGTRKERGKGFDAAGSPNSNENSGRKRSSKKRDGFEKKLDQNYLTAVERGDTEAAQRMVDETAQAAGYNTSKLYHITKSQQFLRWFGDWQNKPDILLQQNLKTDFWRRTESLLLGEGGAPPKMKSKKKCLSVRA